MKSYKDITLKYLKMQKKRSVLTLLGIILSVALLSALSTLMYSLMENMKIDVINRNGNYHVAFKEIKKESADLLYNQAVIEKAGYAKTVGASVIGEYPKSHQEYFNRKYMVLYISAYDTGSLSLLPYRTSEGRLPEKPWEIAVDGWFIRNYDNDIKIGDILKIPIGKYDIIWDQDGGFEETFTLQEEKEYIITGILDSATNITSYTTGNAVTYLDISSLKETDTLNVYMRVTKRTDLDSFVNGIKTKTGGIINYNNSLLSLEGKDAGNSIAVQLIMIGGFLALIIIVATIAVIYNSFSISVLERTSQFGLLRCMGASPAQIKSIVYREAALFGITAIPFGIVIGISGIALLLKIIGFSPLNGGSFRIFVSWISIVLGTFLGTACVYLSALIPAKRAAKVSPLEAVNNTGSIRINDIKKSKKAPILSLVLGFPGSMARKNMKRNKKRFRITVFSIVISSVLFIVFNSLFSFTMQVNPYREMGFDYMIYSSQLYESEIAKIKSIPGISEVYPQRPLFTYRVPVSEDRKGNISNTGDFVYLQLVSYGDEALVKYNLDIDDMADKNGCILIQKNKYKDARGKYHISDIASFIEGDTLKLYSNNDDASEYHELYVYSLQDEGLFNEDLFGHIMALVPEKVYESITGENKFSRLLVSADKSADKEVVSQKLLDYMENTPWMELIDFSAQEKTNREFSFQLFVFFYGFVAAVTLIGSLNIMNTISTSIIQRRREFATLKAVGMSQSQVSRMIIYETILQGIKSGILGGIFGTALIYVLDGLFRDVGALGAFQIPWNSILIAFIGAVTISILSSLAPLRKIKGQDIVSNIRNID